MLCTLVYPVYFFHNHTYYAGYSTCLFAATSGEAADLQVITACHVVCHLTFSCPCPSLPCSLCSVNQPTLEQVFLNVVGEHMQPEE